MKTASFFTYKGAGRVSISRYPPRGTPPGYRVYKALAPGVWFNSVSKEEYAVRFAAQLAKLVPAEVAKDLDELGGGEEPVLLCYERPPFTDANWCHRRIVARWLLETLGLRVPEFVPRKQLEAFVVQHQPEGGFPDGRVLAELSESELVERLPVAVRESLGLA
jgi:hypothetical protein